MAGSSSTGYFGSGYNAGNPTNPQSTPSSNQFFNPLPPTQQATPGVVPTSQAGVATNQQGQGPPGGPTGGIQYGTNPLGNNMVGEIPIDPALTQALLGYLSSNVGKGATPFDLSTVLPSTGQATTPGQLNAPLTPTLADLQNFLTTGKSTNPALQNYEQLATTGKPTDVGPAWDAMVAAQNRNIEQGAAQLREQFAAQGSLASSPFGTAEADYQEQSRKDENATLAYWQMQASEAAAGRQASADQNIMQMQSDIGKLFQGMDQQAINNVLQEFIRTQPEYSPLLNAIFGAAFSYPPVEKTQTGLGVGGALLGGAGSILGGAASLIPAIADVVKGKPANPAANPTATGLAAAGGGAGGAAATGYLGTGSDPAIAGAVVPPPPAVPPQMLPNTASDVKLFGGTDTNTDLTSANANTPGGAQIPTTDSQIPGDPNVFDPIDPKNPYGSNFYNPDVAGGAAGIGSGAISELPITSAGGFSGPTLSQVGAYAPSFDATGAPLTGEGGAAVSGAGGSGSGFGKFVDSLLHPGLASSIALGAAIPLTVLGAMGIGPEQIFKGTPRKATQEDIASKQNTVLESTMKSGSGSVDTILSTLGPSGGKEAATKFLDDQYNQYVQGMQKWMQSEKWDKKQSQAYIDRITQWYNSEKQKIANYKPTYAPGTSGGTLAANNQNSQPLRSTQTYNKANIPPDLQKRLDDLGITNYR